MLKGGLINQCCKQYTCMENVNSMSTLTQSVLENKNKPLFEFFVDGLKDIYWAEKAIEALLKKNKSLAHTEELKEALEDHELQTHKHALRLEKIFNRMKMQPEAKKCDAVAGIIKEAEDVIGKTPEKSMTRDAVIIIAAQKIEHYEIASYGGLLQIALTFNMDSIADMLEKTLDEEEETDVLLSDIAESFINLEASEEDEDNKNEKDEDKDEDQKESDKKKATASKSLAEKK